MNKLTSLSLLLLLAVGALTGTTAQAGNGVPALMPFQLA